MRLNFEYIVKYLSKKFNKNLIRGQVYFFYDVIVEKVNYFVSHPCINRLLVLSQLAEQNQNTYNCV